VQSIAKRGSLLGTPDGAHPAAKARSASHGGPVDGVYALIDGTIGLIAAFSAAPRRSPPRPGRKGAVR
jgi:hypothetical protein